MVQEGFLSIYIVNMKRRLVTVYEIWQLFY